MALIKCPECNSDISDKSAFCPQCGYPINGERQYPGIDGPQKVELTSVNLSKPKSLIRVIGLVLTIVMVSLIAFFGIKKNNELKAQKEFETTFNTYIDSLQVLQIEMLNGAADAEDLTNLISMVWKNAIYEERDPLTDKYTRTTYGFVDDFNIALGNLFRDSTTRSTVSDIEDGQLAVQNAMKELQNPPLGLEKAYDTLSELFLAYRSYTDLAVSPSGSLQSFNESRRTKSDQFITVLHKLQSQIPEKFSEE